MFDFLTLLCVPLGLSSRPSFCHFAKASSHLPSAVVESARHACMQEMRWAAEPGSRETKSLPFTADDRASRPQQKITYAYLNSKNRAAAS